MRKLKKKQKEDEKNQLSLIKVVMVLSVIFLVLLVMQLRKPSEEGSVTVETESITMQFLDTDTISFVSKSDENVHLLSAPEWEFVDVNNLKRRVELIEYYLWGKVNDITK